MSEPLYRLSFEARSLVLDHPPHFDHPHKSLLFEMAYPPGQVPAGVIEVSRWKAEPPASLVFTQQCQIATFADFYDYAPRGKSAASVEWHVNFSDPRLFVAYGSRLFAQDEMQVAEHPLLGSVREALVSKGFTAKTSDESGPTPVLVRNVERRLQIDTTPDIAAGRIYGIYGNRFATASPVVIRQATTPVSPRSFSNIIALAAPAGGSGVYSEFQVRDILSNAMTGFTAARAESQRAAGAGVETVIHTGFWGCGAFGGNRTLMIALQVIAARAGGIDRLILHTGNLAGKADAREGIEVAETLVRTASSRCGFDDMVKHVVCLGLRWGSSDGN
jgi:Poly (ADP-ribose) glycohydrolase (PARG)